MNKLTAEKCREQFEEWGKSQRCELDKWVRGDKAGEYKNPVVAKMWQAWQASRVALPILEQQERGEGWIAWVGGECPVGYDELVEIKCRGGAKFNPNRACQFAWDDAGLSLDIIAYRILPERATNQNGEQ